MDCGRSADNHGDILMDITYGSVCSGIEAATHAWEPLGWKAAWFSEIEKFPSTVLKKYHPDVPNLGDITKLLERKEVYERTIDLLVGGTPCQSFSVAGLRKGMADPRGNLALVFLEIADKLRPRWMVWENVPGVLSSNEGRDFGSFLGGVAELGYGFAYRVLDAQYFGLAQRRERVFVVGYLGDWRPSAAVLFERESLSWNPSPSRQEGETTSHTIAPCIGASGRGFERTGETRGQDPVVCHSLTKRHDSSEDGTGRGSTLVAFSCKDNGRDCQSDLAPTLRSMGHSNSHANGGGQLAVAFSAGNSAAARSIGYTVEATPPLRGSESGTNQVPTIQGSVGVRRLTPRECERLQGFPDDYTKVTEKTKDGPRYKAIGNSMAVPCMRWIGKRIDDVENIIRRNP